MSPRPSHTVEPPNTAICRALVAVTEDDVKGPFLARQPKGLDEMKGLKRLAYRDAKEMLAERNNSIAEIAARTGFNSPIQLTRAFRRVVGVTPSEFRRSAG